MREYDEIAAWYAAVRDPDVGVADIAAVTEGLPDGARVLDLGCGHGLPISRALLQGGFDVTALDSSAEMVEQYRARCPDVPVRCVRVQDARFAPGSFEAVVAWGVLFHLSEADQAAAIGRVARWLAPGGRFLFTSGADRGTTDGAMNGVSFRYVSLGVRGYRSRLAEVGMRLERHHADAWANHVFVAAKP